MAYVAGPSPAFAQTIPHQWVELDPVVIVDFASHAGQLHRLEYSTDLTDPSNWVPSEILITGDGETMHAFDAFPGSPARSYRIVSGTNVSVPSGPVVRAEDCQISALDGHFAYVDTFLGRDVLVSTDPAGNPAYAVGDIKFNFPGVVSNGTYRLTVRWRTGTVAGTPWAYKLGSDSGSVTENGVPTSGKWHYFYPGQSGPHGDQWHAHDLAGPEPVDFSMFPNTAVGSSVTVSGVAAGDFYVRVWDMSPSRDNFFTIEYFQLSPPP
jgi:hypothetical protein